MESGMRQYFQKAYKKSKKEFLEFLEKRMKEEKGTFVVTANPEIFMNGKKIRRMHDALKDKNTCIVPDGIGILHAGERLGYQFQERIPGVEICEALLAYANQMEKEVFLFGAKQEVLAALVKRIKHQYPRIIICGAVNGYVEDKETVFREIVQKQPDVVLVALGTPKQELMIHQYYNPEGKGIYVGVGGSFDVLSGLKKRAPEFFIRHNLEWLYRITTEPQRIKRFWNSNVKFLFEIRKEKNGNRR